MKNDVIPARLNGLLVCFLLVSSILGHNMKAQVAVGDSMDLIGIKQFSCFGCPLNIPGSGHYWDTLQPVHTWPGVGVVNGRVDSLELSRIRSPRTLSGTLRFSNCSELRYLNCSSNLLTRILSFNSLTKLKYLNFSNNYLTALPTLDSLKELEELRFQGNRLRVLPSFDSLRNLSVLDCRSNGLTSLPSLNSQHLLTYLDCSNNNLTLLPSFDNNGQLEILECVNNKLVALPCMDSLINLKRLNCLANDISNIPSFDGLKQLEYLSLTGNQLTSLPAIDSLSSLETLFLTANALSSLPEWNALKSLKIVSLSSNQLISLPNVDSLRFLEYLDCSNNEIIYLPPMANNANLKTLSCGNNELDSLPNLDGLKSLNILNCANNRIAALPSLNKLSNLLSLTCAQNNLQTLPNLDSLVLLSELNCEGNEISILPNLLSISDLEELHCRNNSITFYSITPYLQIPSFAFIPQEDSIQIHQKDTILRLIQAPFILSETHSGGDSTQIQWHYNDQPLPLPSTDTLPNAGTGVYTCTITNPLVPGLTLNSRPVFVVQDEGVRCGDTNRDGIINMLDLAPIGLYFGLTGPPRPDSIRLSGAPLQPALDWTDSLNQPLTYRFGNQDINLKHADANGDGILNQDDLDCIIANYTPLQLPAFLKDTVNPGVSLTSRPALDEIQRIDHDRVTVPFVVRIEDLPADSLKIKGVIFTEPVAESNHYAVDSMAPSYQGSDLLTTQAQLVGFPKYHKNITVNQSDSIYYSCLDVSSHPLDVGIFNRDSAVYLRQGAQIASCIITLDEVFRTANPNNTGLDSIPIILYNYNVLLYVEDQQGHLSILSAKCTTDSIWLNIDSLENVAQIAGAVTTLTGDTLTNYAVQLDRPGKTTLDSCLTNGSYVLKTQWGDSLNAAIQIPKNSAYTGNLDVDDLKLLQFHLQNRRPLTDPYQLIAADVDCSGQITWTDYHLLRAYYNRQITAFPGNRHWVCLKANHSFINPGNPFPLDTSYTYAAFTTRDQQDFLAIQLGDIAPNTRNKTQTAEIQTSATTIFPNPFTDQCHFQFELCLPETIQIDIRNAQGQTVYTFQQTLQPGTHQVPWQARHLPPGLYFARCKMGQEITTHNLLRLDE